MFFVHKRGQRAGQGFNRCNNVRGLFQTKLIFKCWIHLQGIRCLQQESDVQLDAFLKYR